jgi:hypothetical protein
MYAEIYVPQAPRTGPVDSSFQGQSDQETTRDPVHGYCDAVRKKDLITHSSKNRWRDIHGVLAVVPLSAPDGKSLKIEVHVPARETTRLPERSVCQGARLVYGRSGLCPDWVALPD